jgi:hypothetical protein
LSSPRIPISALPALLAGHWVQQEQPERVSELLIQFLDAAG